MISVISYPGGAYLYIDGVYSGVTPVTVSSLVAGYFEVKLTKMGYKDYTTTVLIRPGEIKTIKPVLTQNTYPSPTPSHSPSPEYIQSPSPSPSAQ
jgi:hypothetical protein